MYARRRSASPGSQAHKTPKATLGINFTWKNIGQKHNMLAERHQESLSGGRNAESGQGASVWDSKP